MESKIISRGTGRSVAAASAYMSCSRLYNDYDGVQHDYTRKQGLVWQQVFLPPQAPQEWHDREQLWNAVETAEKTKDSRLAREIIVALPVELDHEEQIALMGAYISQQFVADGTFGERYSLIRMMNSRKQTERMMKEKGNSGKRSVRQEHGREETR